MARQVNVQKGKQGFQPTTKGKDAPTSAANGAAPTAGNAAREQLSAPYQEMHAQMQRREQSRQDLDAIRTAYDNTPESERPHLTDEQITAARHESRISHYLRTANAEGTVPDRAEVERVTLGYYAWKENKEAARAGREPRPLTEIFAPRRRGPMSGI